MNLNFLSAAESYFKSEMDKHALTMNVYMTASVGVGEHPQVVEEFISALEKYSNAADCFDRIQQLKAQLLSSQNKDAENKDES